MAYYSPSAVTTAQHTVRRPSANYHPSLWGDHFLSFSPDFLAVNAWQKEAASLKEKVREKLMNLLKTKDGHGEQLKLIDTIQRLGIAYHFEEEIEQTLNQIFNNHHLQEADDDNPLLISALRFRLLREHGYNVSSDIFYKFKDGKKRFKGARDVQDLLSLYEATYLRVHGEDILDEAREFTTTKLQEMVPLLEPFLGKQVLQALSRPMRRALPRLFARVFISFYQEDEFHDQVLLKFAKLDFNILQKQHQEELSIISRWWKNVDVGVNFPFARDRMVECYFWILSVLHEPQYSSARKFVTKVTAMVSILDDIYDVYGTHLELELFSQAIHRWEINAIRKLPEYMKIYYQALLQVYDEMEEELATSGRSYAINYAKEAMKNTAKAYHEESKWLLQGHKTPAMEEYLKVALESTCYPMIAVTSFVGMGDIVTKQAIDWVRGKPQILEATCLICRLMDDLVSHQREQEREHIPSAVECYMQQYGVSEKEACYELHKQVENAWKDINQGVIDARRPPMAMPMTLLTRILNLARVMDLLYKEDDGYTNSTHTKNYILSLLVDPIQV